MSLPLKQIVDDFALALKAVDESKPKGVSKARVYHPGVGPLSESVAVFKALNYLKTTKARAYSGAGESRYPNSAKLCDVLIPNQWAIEFKLARPFGDNGEEAEHWSENLLHPYPGSISLIGDCLKLIHSGFSEKKAVLVLGYEHDPPKITIEPTIKSFEIIAKDVMGILLGERLHSTFVELIHPVHQQGHVFGWEVTGIQVSQEDKSSRQFGRRKIIRSSLSSSSNSRSDSDAFEASNAVTGEQLNKKWDVGARHALYHKDGTWYHILERFPGALFDTNGFVLFKTESDFKHCSYLNIGEHVNVHDGISHIPGYCKFKQQKGNILICADRDTLGDIISSVLEEVGYHTVVVDSMVDYRAFIRNEVFDVAILTNNATAIALNNIPPMIEDIRGITPDVDIIVATGWLEDDISDMFSGVNLTSYFTLPFTLERLCNELKEIFIRRNKR